jgi:hypothetical protein
MLHMLIIFLIVAGWILIGFCCGIRTTRSYIKSIPPERFTRKDYTISPWLFLVIGVLAGPIGLVVKF